MIVKQVTELIGNTPLLEVDPKVHGLKNINLYAKLELLNPFGSVKDKTAWSMLRHNLDEIKASGQSVIESSSGNTAKAVQMICSINEIPFKIVTNRVKVKEVKQVLQLLGTEIEELPGQSQCLDPTDPNDPLFIVEKIMSSEPGKYFHTTQYTNERNIEAHYEMTGQEIARDLPRVDYFFGGLGTSGSTRGTGQFLKETNPQLKNVGIISSKGGFLPGIRNSDEMYEVGLFERQFYDAVIEVGNDEALDATLALIRRCGVLSGPTGGASFAGALRYLREIDGQLSEKCNAVFLVCDRAEWYLSYFQKYRPELFGLTKKNESVNSISDEETALARRLSPDEAEQWLGDDPRPLVVDLRGSLAFKGGHISHSINIPGETLEEMTEWGIPISQDHKVLFVCPVGDQSRKFAAYFSSRGVESASLEGGFVAWRDASKPIKRLSRTHRAARELVATNS
jgi:cysteine synthase/rhodanese-related sulfurtransferase